MFQSLGPRCRSGSLSFVPKAGHVVAVAVAALVAGCAASETRPSGVAGPRVATAEPPGMRVEIEDDGLPSQIAPKHRRPVTDDPSEPWSPNYGGPRSAKLDTERVAAKLDVAPPAPSPAAYPPHGRPIDPDDIIRRAIAEHEIRRR